MLPSEPYLLSFLHLPDSAGTLISTQDATGLPFDVKRVFWVYASDQGAERGGHAHRTTKELLVVLQGSVRVETETAKGTSTFVLTSPAQGLYIPPFCWITVHPAPNSLLCCSTSTPFEEADYIRSYEEFLGLISE